MIHLQSQDTIKILKERKNNLETLKDKYKSRENRLILICIFSIIISILIFFMRSYDFKEISARINTYFFNYIVIFSTLYVIFIIILIKMQSNDR